MMKEYTSAYWEAFDKENGGDPVKIGRWHVYPSGARREGSYYGASQDPPTDPYERYKIIVAYWSAKLETATKQFDDMKRDALERASINKRQGLYAPQGADYVGKLTALQADVRALQSKLAEAKAELTRHTPPHILNEAAMRAQSDISCDRFAAEIQRIEV